MQWTQQSEVAPWPSRSQAGLAALPGGELLLLGGLVGPRSDVWKSKDNGTSWQRVVEVAPWPARSGHGVTVLPGGAVLVVGGAGAGGRKFADAWRSVDVGATWHRLTHAAPWAPRSGHVVAALDGGVVLVLGGATAEGEVLNDIWRSPDGGQSWDRLLEAAPWPARAFAGSTSLQHSGKSSVLVLGGSAGEDSLLDDIWCSDDGGSTWDLVLDGAPWAPRRGHVVAAVPAPGVAFDANEEALLMMGGFCSQGPQADVWRSLDGGSTWKQLLKEAEWAPRLEHRAAVLPDGSVVMIGGQASSKGGYLNDVWRGTLGDAPPRPKPAPPAQPKPMPAARSAGGYPMPQGKGEGKGQQPPLAPQIGRPEEPEASGATQGPDASGSRGLSPPPPRTAPPSRAREEEGQIGKLPPLQGGPPTPAPAKAAPKAPAASSGGGNPMWPKYETMPAADLRKAVLELQRGLADITRRLDTVGSENQLLKEENSLLKEAIDDKIESQR